MTDPNMTQPMAAYYPPPMPPRRRHRGRNWAIALSFVGAMALIIGLVAAAANSTPRARIIGQLTTPAPLGVVPEQTEPAAVPSTPSLQALALGTSIEETGSDDDGNQMAQTITAVSVKFRTSGCGQFSDAAKRGTKYLVLAVAYSVSQGKGEYNPFDWTMTDAAGNPYDTTDAIFGNCGTLDSSNAAHGKHKGTVAFVVPAALKHGVIILDDGGTDTVSWKF